MYNCKELNIGYEYVIENYMDDRQLEYYEQRAINKGLSETEKVLVSYYFSKTDAILDVGTGCGRFAIGAYKEGFKNVYGIDMNPRFIERAIQISKDKFCDIKFSVQNAESTTFKDKTFETVIFTSDGFSQIPGNENKLTVLKEIYRIMKPGGVFILTIIDEELVRENAPDYAKMIDNFREREAWKFKGFYDQNDIAIYDGGYMHFASIKEMTSLISKSSFKHLFNVSAKDILGEKDKKSSNISRFFVLAK